MRALKLLAILTILIVNLSGCSFLGGLAPHKYIQYPVSKDETLSSIADRFSVSTKEIERLNPHIIGKPLLIGAYLRIPFDGESLEKTKKSWLDQLEGQKSERKISTKDVKQYLGHLLVPIKNPRLTSPFGMRGERFHEGMDLAAPTGTSITAAHNGKVVFETAKFGKYGRVVVIEGEKILTVYAHNSKNHVSTGELVSAGEEIAEVGQTGDATGPHVHFEVRIKDPKGRYVAVDPRLFLKK